MRADSEAIEITKVVTLWRGFKSGLGTRRKFGAPMLDRKRFVPSITRSAIIRNMLNQRRKTITPARVQAIHGVVMLYAQIDIMTTM